MSENPGASDWAAERGDPWRAEHVGMEAMLAPIDEPLIRALHLDAPYRIADIGCGGGGTTLEIVRRAPMGSLVHGYDISPALIDLCRGRASQHSHPVAFEIADMASSTPREPYERLVSRFGIMFFDRPQAAFANLRHWLVPGGRFAFATWGRPTENPWLTNVREVVATLVDLPAPDPDAPGLFRYADSGKLLALLEGAGFGRLDVHDWHGELAIGGGLSAADAAHFALSSFSSLSDLLNEASGAKRAAAQRALRERFARHLQHGVVRIGASVHLVTGTRPA